MIGIIGAMELEVEGIRALMTDKKEKTVSGIRFVSGMLGECETVTAVCGVGKVFAAICAEAMIVTYAPGLVINLGVAGSLDPGLSIGDIVVADRVVQHDMDTSAIGDPLGLLSGIGLVYLDTDEKASERLYECIVAEGLKGKMGTVASGDRFVASSDIKAFIVKNFGASACEMEGAAIGQVCYVNGVPFAVLRAISDCADEGADVDFPSFCRTSADNYIKVVSRFATAYAD